MRARMLEGYRFRRQHQIGPYYADFVCTQSKLIIEADGTQHHDEEQYWYDYKRTKYLEAQGYRVLRFHNLTILRSIGVVQGIIVEALKV